MYSREEILELANKVLEAIKALITLRRLDEDGYIGSDGITIYKRTSDFLQNVINEFEDFWENKHGDQLCSISIFVKNMTENYNYLLDLCEPDVIVNESTRDKWLNKPNMTIDEVDIYI